MSRRTASWQDMMRDNLELRLLTVVAPKRARPTPVLFTAGGRNWLSLLPVVARGKARLH